METNQEVSDETRDASINGTAPAVEAAGAEQELRAGAELQAEASSGRKKEKRKIKFESLMQRDEAVAYFAALVDGLRHGHLQFRQKEEALELDPASQVAVEVKASRKGDKEKVSFELSWRAGTEPELEVSG